MSNMIPFQQAALPAYMQQFVGNNDINQQATAGIGGESVNHISVAGGRFTVVRGQAKTPLQVFELELIFVHINPGLNKAYYSTPWNPDQDAQAPDCSSDDGVTPRADSPALQCNACAACPQNQFGSKINPQTGAKSKACSDKKFMAVVSPGQASGEMLRFAVPTASLGDLATALRGLPKIPYFAVVFGVSFDETATYPKLKFRPIRYVDEAEMPIIMERHNSDEAKQFAGVAGSQPLRAPQPAVAQIPVQQIPEQPAMQQVPPHVQQAQQPQGFGQAPQQAVQQAPVQQAPVQQAPQGFGQAPQQPTGFGQAPQQAPAQPAQQGFGQAPQQPQGFGQAAQPQNTGMAPPAAADTNVAAVFGGQGFSQPAQQAQQPTQQPKQQAGGIPDVLPSGRVPGKPSPGKKRRTKAEMEEDKALGIGTAAGETSEEDNDAQQAQQPQQPQQPQQAQQGFGQPAQQPQPLEQPANQPPVMTGDIAAAFAGWDD